MSRDFQPPQTSSQQDMKGQISPRYQVRRWLLSGLGWVFVGLGVLGVILPGLPTTPFLLLALWCFTRSSPRLHHWLLNHPRFGQGLRDWENHRVIPPKAKALALIMMLVSFLLIAFWVKPPLYAVGLVGGILVLVAIYIVTRPGQAQLLEEVRRRET